MDVVSRNGVLLEPKGYLSAALRPAKGVLFHHSVTYATPEDHAKCVGSWRHVQNVAFARGYTDVSYHYGICPHGVIFEGRKADRSGAHCDCPGGHNRTHIGACLIGNYQTNPLPPAMEQAMSHLVVEHLGTPRQETWPHRKFKATACCGQNALPAVEAVRTGGALPPPPPPQPTPPPPPPQPTDWTTEVIMSLPTLDLRNAHNSAVKHQLVDNLQGLLEGARIDIGGIDGFAGRNTQAGVKKFQQMAGLDQDAIVGRNTWTRLINW